MNRIVKNTKNGSPILQCFQQERLSSESEEMYHHLIDFAKSIKLSGDADQEMTDIFFSTL
jgi:hypothetical protein